MIIRQEVRKVKDMKIHKIANMHRSMNDKEYQALKLSIEESGQLVPVILYRGFIVDGRHRLKALKELGFDTIICNIMNHKMTLEDVENAVIGTEMRRNDNTMQKAIRALRWIQENDKTQSEAAIKFGVNQSHISKMNKIEKALGSDITNQIFKDGFLIIGNKKYGNSDSLLKAIEISKAPMENMPKNVPESVKGVLQTISELALVRDHISLAAIKTELEKIIRELNSE